MKSERLKVDAEAELWDTKAGRMTNFLRRIRSPCKGKRQIIFKTVQDFEFYVMPGI